jgi:hypothetical protein
MSLGGKKDGNNPYDLIVALCIGIAIVAFGLSAAFDRLYHSYIHDLIDLGTYHSFIGIGVIGLGLLYLALVLKNFLAKKLT